MKAVFGLACCILLLLSTVNADPWNSSPESNESGQRCEAGTRWTTNLKPHCQSCVCSVRGFAQCTDVPCPI